MTTLGEVTIVGDETGICRLHLLTTPKAIPLNIDPNWQQNDLFFTDVKQQLMEYLDGKRQDFSVKLAPVGTEFQRKVWQQLTKIPYGQTASYKDIAIKTGNPKASRAVGMANNKNPIPVIIPCHRVIGANGKLTGYAYGLAIKERLLNIEQMGS